MPSSPPVVRTFSHYLGVLFWNFLAVSQAGPQRSLTCLRASSKITGVTTCTFLNEYEKSHCYAAEKLAAWNDAKEMDLNLHICVISTIIMNWQPDFLVSHRTCLETRKKKSAFMILMISYDFHSFAQFKTFLLAVWKNASTNVNHGILCNFFATF